jgi:hypothetical protein
VLWWFCRTTTPALPWRLRSSILSHVWPARRQHRKVVSPASVASHHAHHGQYSSTSLSTNLMPCDSACSSPTAATPMPHRLPSFLPLIYSLFCQLTPPAASLPTPPTLPPHPCRLGYSSQPVSPMGSYFYATIHYPQRYRSAFASSSRARLRGIPLNTCILL